MTGTQDGLSEGEGRDQALLWAANMPPWGQGRAKTGLWKDDKLNLRTVFVEESGWVGTCCPGAQERGLGLKGSGS